LERFAIETTQYFTPVDQNKAIQTTNLRPRSKYFTHLFFAFECANDSILQVRPHLFIVCAEIASAAAVYTVHLWLGWLVQMQFIHTRTLTKGERKRIWSKAAV
jgi:hypothetical protein